MLRVGITMVQDNNAKVRYMCVCTKTAWTLIWCWCVVMCACSLRSNNIGAGGAVALGKALEVNSSLQTLKYVVVGVNLRVVVVGMFVQC